MKGKQDFTRFFKLVSLLVLLVSTVSLFGQNANFPVTIIPQATPPAPIYFSNYADASTTNSPLRVQIVLNDFTIPHREIRLKTYFQGRGINFQSNDVVSGASPMYLEGGVPLILTNAELAPYFKFENITGISPNTYGSIIPEGSYQFCFEVYDVATGSKLSNKSCVTTVIFENEPPFLIAPRNKSHISETNPQYIVFQWTPRNINVTNVSYELSLVEIWDNQIDPQAAFLSSPPIFQTTTAATSYVFGPSDPQLLSGKNYAWRIQAKAKQGAEDIGLYKNQGYSEIFSFSYSSACDLPTNINHEVKGSSIASVFWDDFSNEVPEYVARYRVKSDSITDAAWFYNKTTGNTTSLWGLKADTTYEYQVQKKCTVTKSNWSLAEQFTTFIADSEASVYECGITPDFTLSNTDPLQNLAKGDTFTAGDFPIYVLTSEGSNGRFTGTGYVTIPYLNSIKVSVDFTNVLINTDKQLAEGTVVTKYDKTGKNILDVDAAIETVSGVAEALGEPFEGTNDLDEIRINWVLDHVNHITIKDDVLVITNPANGATETSPLGDDKVIVDSENNVYHVDAKGKVTKGGSLDPSGGVNTGNVTGISQNGDIVALTAEGIRVTFENDSIFGYDKMPNNANDKLKEEYTTVPDAAGKDYTLAHFAVEKEKTIFVDAKIELSSNSEYTLADLKFKTKTGELITPTNINNQANTLQLPLKGRYTIESETIYAVVESKQDSTKQHTAGALTLWHLTDRAVNVVLVSVDNATLPDPTTITNIFKKGVTTLNFDTKYASLDTSTLGTDGKLEIGDSPWLTSYNTEQKAVITNLKSQIDYHSSNYYVFVFPKTFETTKPIAGFMPLQRQFGFVFSSGLDSGEEAKGDLATVTAHELGHGIFALQHPFTQYGMPEGGTDLLMDYKKNATALNHMNWEQMHNPALRFYVFQDEEDGEYSPEQFMVGSNVIPGKFSQHVTRDYYSFVSIANKIFSLPNTVQDVTFGTNGELFAFTLNENGTLVRYAATASGTKFIGYAKEKGNKDNWKERVYQDSNSISTTGQSVDVFTGKYNKTATDCGIDLYSGKFLNTSEGSWNSGGNGTVYSTDFSAFNTITSRILLKEKISSPEACDLCENGEDFYNNQISKLGENASESEIENLLLTSKLICNTDYKIEDIIAFFGRKSDEEYNKISGLFKATAQAAHKKAVDEFWNRPNAWKLFYNKLNSFLNVIKEAKNVNEIENTPNASADILEYLLYLDEEIIDKWTIDEQIEVLNYLAIKEKRLIGDQLFGMFSKIDEERALLRLLTANSTDKALVLMAELASPNEDLGSSVLSYLFDHIDDYGGEENFTLLIKKLTNISLTSIPKPSGGTFGDGYTNEDIEFLNPTKLVRDVVNKNYVISILEDKINYEITFDNNTSKITIKKCTKWMSVYDPHSNTQTEQCLEKEILLNNIDPFTPVALTIINDISFFGTNCYGGNTLDENNIWCGQARLVPAIFMYYLDQKGKTKIVENLTINSVVIAGTILTAGEVGAAVAAGKTATAVWAGGELLYTVGSTVYINELQTQLSAAVEANNLARENGNISLAEEKAAEAAEIESIISVINNINNVFLGKAVFDVGSSLKRAAAIKKAKTKLQGKISTENYAKLDNTVNQLEDDIKRLGKETEYDDAIASFTNNASESTQSLLAKLKDFPQLKIGLTGITDITLISKLDELTKTEEGLEILSRLNDDFVRLEGLSAYGVFKNNIKDPDYLDGWIAISKREEMRLDPSILESMKNLIKNNRTYITQNQELFDTLFERLAQARAGCKSCPSSNNMDTQVGYMEDIIDNLDDAITKYSREPSYNFQGFLNDIKRTEKSAKGGVFTLTLLRSKIDEMSSGGFTFTRFEGSIPDIQSGHQLDLLFTKGRDPNLIKRSIEIKNWKDANSVGFEQFKAYISSGNDFLYYFNGTQDAMKTSFKNVFKNKAPELWDVRPEYFLSQKLKIPSTNEDVTDVESFLEFIDEVSIYHTFFSFIK
ncbi:fibronectin type III domain-containing protein [Pseudotamlana agarivorans]|uniref:fibronectin type III domain-containing protein n=1 Tax=Pseudotamlana agarivorans TaxID=481183 RepID=UPI00082AEB6A|nr:fibronectin type III domain-containing protein [Tamlana agarivorans]